MLGDIRESFGEEPEWVENFEDVEDDEYLERLGIVEEVKPKMCLWVEHVTDPLTFMPMQRQRWVTAEWYDKHVGKGK